MTKFEPIPTLTAEEMRETIQVWARPHVPLNADGPVGLPLPDGRTLRYSADIWPVPVREPALFAPPGINDGSHVGVFHVCPVRLGLYAILPFYIEDSKPFPKLEQDARTIQVIDYFAAYLSWVKLPPQERPPHFMVVLPQESYAMNDGAMPILPILVEQQLSANGLPPLPGLTNYVLRRACEKTDTPFSPDFPVDAQPKCGLAVTMYFLAPLRDDANPALPRGVEPWADIAVGLSSISWAGSALTGVGKLEKHCRKWWREIVGSLPSTSSAGRPVGSNLWFIEQARKILSDEKREYIAFEEYTAWADQEIRTAKGCLPDDLDWIINLNQARTDIQKGLHRAGIAYRLKNGDIKYPPLRSA